MVSTDQFKGARSRILSLCFVATALLPCCPALVAQNATQTENAKPGSADWQLTNPATNHEIEGYASLTSVNRGGQISFYINTADPTYTVEVFRMGWYTGAGARRVLGPVTANGTQQTIPTPDPTTGIVECQWTNPFTISVPGDADPTNWASGVYLARLTGDTSRKQSFIIFTVRDDSRSSMYVFQLTMNTFEAYNNWGGKSLYTWNSTGGIAAVNVSYNRPFALGNQPASASGVGAGEFLTNVQPVSQFAPAGWAYNTVRFLEREGYDVTYLTDVDVHESGSLLLPHRTVIIAGHSEYWSWEMRTNLQAARDAGVGIAVFSANTCYWQIRFTSSAFTGASDRTIIAYKSTADPDASNPALAHLTTVRWREAPVSLPEEALFGVMYQTDGVSGDLVVSNASSWVYTYTGVQNGTVLHGLWGYEIDSMQGHQPAGTVAVMHETTGGGAPGDSTVYTAASGATVFDIGSFDWNWGLDDYNVPRVRASVMNPIAQQVTRNVLARLAGQPLPTSFSIIPSPRVQTVNAITGGSVSYTVSVSAFGYSPNVTLSASGLPPNTSATFSPSVISGSGTSTLTVSVGAPAPLGTYLITINAQDGVQTRTEAVTLVLANMSAKSTWKLLFADSQETSCINGSAPNGFDGTLTTMWHTQYCPTTASLPHEIQIDLGASFPLKGFGYVPRQDGGVNGRIGQYEFYVTNNFSNWGSPVAMGVFANDASEKIVSFPQGNYRYVRLRALTEANGGPWTSMAELDLFADAPPAGRFIPAGPCRVADTRVTGGPLGAGATRNFTIQGTCGIPAGALAYSLNLTVVPNGSLGYVSMWPASQSQPVVSTLNSLDGRVKSNAAIVPAGTGGAVSVYATNSTQVILDVNGYFDSASDPSALAFYPLAPCRVADTRTGTGALGGPSLIGSQTRNVPVLSSPCNIPGNALAYSLNFTAIPRGPLGYLTVWPAGQSRPLASTLNAPTGAVTANAAIVPAGTAGAIDLFVTDNTDMVIDINGYFAAPAAGGFSLYNLTPCRIKDTRLPAGTPPFTGTIAVTATAVPCGVPPQATALISNATVVPSGVLGYLTLWANGASQPVVSTLNALDGSVTSNQALVPITNGFVNAYSAGPGPTYLVLDVSGYFAP